jgi:fermentation-respiration switch protein FrsA (DUF1100 family)
MTNNKNAYWRNISLVTLGVMASVCLALLIGFSHRLAESYLHPGRVQRPAGNTPALAGVRFQDVRLTTQDGVILSAWYTPSQNGRVILVAHGYGSVREWRLHAALAHIGYGVLSWDARAHGESGGTTVSWGYNERLDVEAALDYARLQPGVAHVGALGQSMGAATLVKAAAERPGIEALVLDSSFAAIGDMVDRQIPIVTLWPFTIFFLEQGAGVTMNDVRPVDDIRRISPRPVFIIQGGADSVIPSDSAQRLYAAAGEPRSMWLAPGVAHADCFRAMSEIYLGRVTGFFESAFGDDDAH